MQRMSMALSTTKSLTVKDLFFTDQVFRRQKSTSFEKYIMNWKWRGRNYNQVTATSPRTIHIKTIVISVLSRGNFGRNYSLFSTFSSKSKELIFFDQRKQI